MELLARCQHTVFTVRQLASIGLGRSGAAYRSHVHRLHRIHHGVYSLVPKELLTREGHYMAAVLACGPAAALSEYAAAKLRGLMDSSRTQIDVTVPTRGVRVRKGIRVHRSTTLRPQDIELVRGIPCTTVARTIFDLADRFFGRRLERLLDEAAYLEVLDFSALQEQMQHNRGRVVAVSNLCRVFAEHRPGSTLTDGPLGEQMLALIAATDLPLPKVQYCIDLGDGEPMIHADFAWPEAKVILETDGRRAHGSPRRTAADYRRDQRAAKAGWYTMRVTGPQIRREPERLKETVVTLVKTRLAQLAA